MKHLVVLSIHLLHILWKDNILLKSFQSWQNGRKCLDNIFNPESQMIPNFNKIQQHYNKNVKWVVCRRYEWTYSTSCLHLQEKFTLKSIIISSASYWWRVGKPLFESTRSGCLETCIKQEDVHGDIFLSSPSTLVVKENAVTLDFLWIFMNVSRTPKHHPIFYQRIGE